MCSETSNACQKHTNSKDDAYWLYRRVGHGNRTVKRHRSRLHLWSSRAFFHVEEGVRRICYSNKRQRHGSQLRRIRGKKNKTRRLKICWQTLFEERKETFAVNYCWQVQFNGVNQGRCGECGDEWSLPRPRSNDEGGPYGNGVIGKTYKQGSVSMQVHFHDLKNCSWKVGMK